MTINGNLTALLKQDYQQMGYGLKEDEDFLYVVKDFRIIATFNARSASIDRVNQFIEENKHKK